eukprot:562563-Rhodomonas_salina.3
MAVRNAVCADSVGASATRDSRATALLVSYARTLGACARYAISGLASLFWTLDPLLFLRHFLLTRSESTSLWHTPVHQQLKITILTSDPPSH